MGTFTSHDAAVLHYDIRGRADGSPVVVLAGGPARHPDYLGDLAGLDTVRPLLFLHQRGVGRSVVDLDQLMAWPALADDLEALRTHLGRETLDVMAHSAGARVALAWAAGHPDRVGRLCLVTPPAGWLVDVRSDTDELIDDRRDEPWYAAYQRAQPALAAVTSYAEFLPLAHIVAPLGWAAWNDRAQSHEQAASYGHDARLAFFAASPDHDLAPDLRAVSAPVLVIAAARDAAVGVRPVLALAELFSNARTVTIPGAGHYPWVERPDRFYRAVASFLLR